MNPAELAEPFAELLMTHGSLDTDYSEKFEQDQLEVLESLAAQHGMLNKQYFVYTHKSFITPNVPGTEREKKQTNELGFYGNLLSFSAVRTPNIIGYGAIRTLCLTFTDVNLVPLLAPDKEFEAPEFDTTDVLIHTPPTAIKGMGDLAA